MVKRAKNPFVTDSIVYGDDYCRRKKLEDRILSRLESGLRLALIGDRRVGKSSTAHYLIDGMKNTHKVDVDFYHVKDANDVSEAIIDSCKKILDEVWSPKEVMEYLKRLYPELKSSAQGISLSIGVREKIFKKTLNFAFEVLDETIKKTKRKIVILFDEFQTIGSIEDGDAILKYIRGKIQKQRRIPVMYVGSIRNAMDKMFRDPGSPFFKQAEVIYFDNIEESVFYNFVSKKFRKKKIKLEKGIFKHLYEICYGITGDIQSFCRTAFDSLRENTVINSKVFFDIIDIMYKNELKYFKELMEGRTLTKIQKNLLLQMADAHRLKVKKFFSEGIEMVVEAKSPGSVRNAIIALEKKGHIYKHGDQYRFSNPIFKEWLLDKKVAYRFTEGPIYGGNPYGTRLDHGYRKSIKREIENNSK